MADDKSSSAFTTELAASQRRLLGYIMTLVPSFSDAEDILQNTNARLVAKADEYPNVDNFAAWASRFAYFEVLNFRKQKARDPHVFHADEALLGTLASEAEERFSASDEMIAALEHCEKKLSHGDRALIADRYQSGRTVIELAEQSGRSAGAVRQALYKIRRALLRCIQHQLAKSQ